MNGKQIWSAVILLMVGALSGWAVLNGDIEGFVADSSGAFVPGVSVSITSLETRAQRYLITDDRGHFLATLLPIGEYEVRAELAGFKPALKRLLVKSAEQARLNLTLEVGNYSAGFFDTRGQGGNVPRMHHGVHRRGAKVAVIAGPGGGIAVHRGSHGLR